MNFDNDPLLDLAVSSRIAGVSADQRRAMIAEAAYFRAEARGFEPGAEVDDWLDAEYEIEQRLAEHGLTAVADAD